MKPLPEQIYIRVKATHFDYINKNHVLYTERAVKKGSKTWVAPYNKPQLVSHDKNSDPIGRVVSYKIRKTDSTTEPPNYVELVVKITDIAAIEKILDGRYSTVSVGSRTSRVICSECNQILTEDGLCEHKKGSYNDDGIMVHWIIDQIDYVEDSFVNEPADDYAGIDEVNIGRGWVNYVDFLDNRESYINKLQMEDYMKDTKLTSKARQSLSDSSFCYVITQDEKKIRKFPVHDAEHVRNSLSKLPQSDLCTSAKSKVLGCLARRASRFDIDVSDAMGDCKECDVNADSIDETDGINGEWTADEILSMTDLFKEDPRFDLLDGEEDDVEVPDEGEEGEEENSDSKEDIMTLETKALKRAELSDLIGKLRSKITEDSTSYKKDIETRDTKITSLEDRASKAETEAIERENEVNKYLDQYALITKNHKDAVIQNIVDLKMTDNNNETREALTEKLAPRKLESLVDTLEDLRLSLTSIDNTDSVEDPTLQTEQETNTEQQDHTDDSESSVKDPKFKIFERDRS